LQQQCNNAAIQQKIGTGKTSASGNAYPTGLRTSDSNYATDAFGNGFFRNNDH